MKTKRLIFHSEHCDFCGSCVAVCKPDALLLLEASLDITPDRCTGCGRCTLICPLRALTLEKL